MDYKRNTVAVPRPTKQELEERHKFEGAIANFTDRQPKYEPKVCATSLCPWCYNKQEGYVIVCRFCTACVYCGLIDNGGIELCDQCGNKAPDDIKYPFKEKRIVKHRGEKQRTILKP